MTLVEGYCWVCLLACSGRAAPAATFEELAAQAGAAREANRLAQAIDLYHQALQLKPDWSEGWWYLGTLYYDSDKYSSAQDAFARFVKLADKPPGWAFLGLCEFETGAYAQAQEHLQKGLDGGVAPEMQQVVHFHLALLLTRQGLFDQAWHAYGALAQQGVRDPTLVDGMGLNGLNKPMLPRETPPDQRPFISAAGRAAYAWMAGDKTQAEAAFRALLADYPTAPGVHNLYAAYLLGSRPDEAMAELRRELELNPQSAESRALMALLLLKSDHPAEASPYAKKAAEDRPTSALAQYVYGLTLTDLRQAAEHLEMAERLDPSNFEHHVALAHVYAKTGRHDDARRERKLAIRLARESGPDAGN